MIRIITVILSFFFLLRISAQTREWTSTIEGEKYKDSRAIVLDEIGNSYIIGWFQGAIDLDPGSSTKTITARRTYDSYIVKLDSKGDLLWGFNLEGTGDIRFYDLAIDKTGDVYITGDFTKTIDFDPGTDIFNLTSVGGDTFILKLDATGNFQKAVSFSDSYNRAHSIEIDNMGNIYTTGYFRDTTDFDPGPEKFILESVGSAQFADIFICKLDSETNLQWVRSFGGYDYSEGVSVTIDRFGNVYFTGTFFGTVDFDPGEGVSNVTSKGRSDFFVSKFDTNGNIKWVHTFGSSIENDIPTYIDADSYGNVYLSGYFSGTMDFDSSEEVAELTPTAETNNFLLKIDPNGFYRWAINTPGQSFTIDAEDNIYTTGRFKGTFDFDRGESTHEFSSNGENDISITKYSSNSTYLWTTTFGGLDYDSGNYISSNDIGNIIYTGKFSGTVDFGDSTVVENLSSQGENAIFINKLNYPIPEIEEKPENKNFKIYPNPTTGLVNIDFEELIIPTIIVTDVNGRKVYEQNNISENPYSFTLNGASGIYFIKIIIDEVSQVIKVMKK